MKHNYAVIYDNSITEIQDKTTAYLYCDSNYSFFQIGNKIIKFATSPYLIRYTKIKHYDNGYMVVDANYVDPDDPNIKYIDEDYIDMEFVFHELSLDTQILSNITEVKIK